MLTRLANKLILCPTRNPIETEHRVRHPIETPEGAVEAWVSCLPQTVEAQTPSIVGIKFPGTGGRAERGGPHPFEILKPLRGQSCEMWTINHHGYGGSEGPADLNNFASTCDAVWQHVEQAFPNTPIVVIGNSLGCISALYVAANYDPVAVYLRNPVPLKQMIADRPRYNWWNFGMAKHLAAVVPCQLDAVENGKRAAVPVLFVRSELDRVIPAKYQKMIFDNYGGDRFEFVIEGADHHHRVQEGQVEAYCESANDWVSSWKTP